MDRATLLAWICNVGLLLTGCTRAPPSAMPVFESAAKQQLAVSGSLSLMTWQEVGAACEWAVLEPPQFTERVFLRSLKCPDRVVWNQASQQTLFALDGLIYLHAWQAATVATLGSPPVPTDSPDLGFSSSGAVRFCSYETRTVDATASEYWIWWERAVDGTWLKAVEQPLEERSLTTCLGELDLQRTGSMYYNPGKLLPSNCASEPTAGEVCPSSAAIAQFRAQLGAGQDAVEYLAFSSSSFLAYPYIIGDTSHVHVPVFTIEGDHVTRIYDRRRRGLQQWDILLAGDYFLVRDEIRLTLASLFAKGSATPIIEFPDATRAIWIPGTMAMAAVIEMQRR